MAFPTSGIFGANYFEQVAANLFCMQILFLLPLSNIESKSARIVKAKLGEYKHALFTKSFLGASAELRV
jgi:hypothetical protein